MPPDLRDLLKLMELIEVDFRENHDPNFYAGKVGYTMKRVNVLCRKYYGKTLYELIQERVHEEALKLLEHTSLTIGQITYELGVSDPSWFTKRFKKRMGVKPLEWRREKALQDNVLSES